MGLRESCRHIWRPLYLRGKVNISASCILGLEMTKLSSQFKQHFFFAPIDEICLHFLVKTVIGENFLEIHQSSPLGQQDLFRN